MGREKKINGDAIQVNEERNRRASIFSSINPLNINTSQFDAIATRWEYVSLVVSLYKFQYNNLGMTRIFFMLKLRVGTQISIQ